MQLDDKRFLTFKGLLAGLAVGVFSKPLALLLGLLLFGVQVGGSALVGDARAGGELTRIAVRSYKRVSYHTVQASTRPREWGHPSICH